VCVCIGCDTGEEPVNQENETKPGGSDTVRV